MKEEKATHTPGPWNIQHKGTAPFIESEPIGARPIAQWVSSEANARLIAASPTMLAALLRIRKALNMNPKAAEDALRDDPEAWDALRAAIESAGGF